MLHKTDFATLMRAQKVSPESPSVTGGIRARKDYQCWKSEV